MFPINCKEEECAWPLSTPATMVSHDAGDMLLVSSIAVLFMHSAQSYEQTAICCTA